MIFVFLNSRKHTKHAAFLYKGEHFTILFSQKPLHLRKITKVLSLENFPLHGIRGTQSIRGALVEVNACGEIHSQVSCATNLPIPPLPKLLFSHITCVLRLLLGSAAPRSHVTSNSLPECHNVCSCTSVASQKLQQCQL